MSLFNILTDTNKNLKFKIYKGEIWISVNDLEKLLKEKFEDNLLIQFNIYWRYFIEFKDIRRNFFEANKKYIKLNDLMVVLDDVSTTNSEAKELNNLLTLLSKSILRGKICISTFLFILYIVTIIGSVSFCTYLMWSK